MGSLSNSKLDLPVIDISIENPNASTELLDAAAKYGFVFIENDDIGIPPQKISQMFELSEKFFSSPVAVKQEVAISSNAAGKNHGWLSRGVERLDPKTQEKPDVKEAFNIGEHVNRQLQQPLPTSLQDDSQTIVDFQDLCHAFCMRIFEHFAQALELEQDWFTSRHDRREGPSGTVFRLLFYPHVEDVDDDVDIRAGAHSDYGSITLLFQLPGQPGLEIKTPTGEWAAVPVDPLQETIDSDSARTLPILVNFGDLLEDWTGGLLKSTVHRVIFPKSGQANDRYSIAYFCHPLDDAELVPVPSKKVQDHARETGKGGMRDGKVLTAKDHLMERLAATYSVG